jgi:putative transposase
VAYRWSNETVYSANYHLMWCPRYRRRVLGECVEIRLKEVVAGVLAEGGGEIIEVQVMPDGVQVVVGSHRRSGCRSWSSL